MLKSKCPFCGKLECVELPHEENENYEILIGNRETGETTRSAWVKAYGCLSCKKVYLEAPSLHPIS